MIRLKEKLQAVTGFIRDVRTELVKSSWPTRQELVESTMVLIVSVILFSIFIGISDFTLSRLIGLIVR